MINKYSALICVVIAVLSCNIFTILMANRLIAKAMNVMNVCSDEIDLNKVDSRMHIIMGDSKSIFVNASIIRDLNYCGMGIFIFVLTIYLILNNRKMSNQSLKGRM